MELTVENMETQNVADQISERNEILSRWYKDQRIKRILSFYGMEFTKFRDAYLLGDFKNSIFLRLAEKPLTWLRDMDNPRSYLGYFYRSVKREYLLLGKNDNYFDDFVEKAGNVVEEDLPMDMYQSVVEELETLPYVEKKALTLYSESFSADTTYQAMNMQGIKISLRATLEALTNGRERIQQQLLRKGIIEKKISFEKIYEHAFLTKTNRKAESLFTMSKHMRRMESLATNKYSSLLSVPEKTLIALLHAEHPIDRNDIFKIIKERFEGDIEKRIIRSEFIEIAARNITKYIHRGFVYTEKQRGFHRGGVCTTKYFLPEKIKSYLKDYVDNKHPLSEIPGNHNRWFIYDRHKKSKKLVPTIAENFRMKPEDVEQLSSFCHEFCESLVRARKEMKLGLN